MDNERERINRGGGFREDDSVDLGWGGWSGFRMGWMEWI